MGRRLKLETGLCRAAMLCSCLGLSMVLAGCASQKPVLAEAKIPTVGKPTKPVWTLWGPLYVDSLSTHGKPKKTIKTPWGEKQIYDPASDLEFLVKFNSLKEQCEEDVFETQCIDTLKLVFFHHRLQDVELLKAGCRGILRTNGRAVNFKRRKPKPSKDYILFSTQYELAILGADVPEYDHKTGKPVVANVNNIKRFENLYTKFTGTAFSGSELKMSEVFEFHCGFWSQYFHPTKEN